MRQKTIYLVADDTGPDLPVRFDGLDLSNYSAITMEIKYSDYTTKSKTVTPDPSDAELGYVAWEAGDLKVGKHQAEFQLIQASDDKIVTLPRQYAIILNIRADLT